MVVIFALIAPVLLGIVGVAVDYASWALQRSTLQQTADAAALAVMSDLQVVGASEQRMQSLARSYVDSTVKLARGDGPVSVVTLAVARERSGGSFVPAGWTSGARTPTGVKVTLTQRKHAIMSRLVTPHLTDITVSATAEAMGSSKLCVLGLASRGGSAIHLKDFARIDADSCVVYALSAHAGGLTASEQSTITATRTCTVGGFHGGRENFKPLPVTGCPALKDPLASLPPPSVGSCVATDLSLTGGTHTLSPGTYCGGLSIDGGAEVTMRPGIYVMKDGPLIVGPAEQRQAIEKKCKIIPISSGLNPKKQSLEICRLALTVKTTGYMKGNGVGIYFTGDIGRAKVRVNQPLLLLPNSVVELTAPRDGDMAGLLFFEDRKAPAGRSFDILSDSARRLVGTIYLPRGTFSVQTNQVVADQSEYTAIVANQIFLANSPRLVINTRYSATDVPVPRGLGPKSGTVGLAD
ncbi:TadE/TadG family type IV pilus assembly protein [Methylobacterium sp. 174MFSha1.1]|uniref:TadE/TadG family type IV pilus assembly protein n=1 Tax=Methylobacterium sp. 174MFSha1.1 TaxID=1502749 RepID=UPI001FCD05EB|nr:TadE/TadG family type IV pilus assembly protein [Methylobacterium sp. 174MFSha1.1]